MGEMAEWLNRLLPSLRTWVWSLGPLWLKERNNSQNLLSVLHTCSMELIHINPYTHIYTKWHLKIKIFSQNAREGYFWFGDDGPGPCNASKPLSWSLISRPLIPPPPFPGKGLHSQAGLKLLYSWEWSWASDLCLHLSSAWIRVLFQLVH